MMRERREIERVRGFNWVNDIITYGPHYFNIKFKNQLMWFFRNRSNRFK